MLNNCFFLHLSLFNGYEASTGKIIYPSIVFCLFVVKLQMQQFQKGNSDIPLPRDTSQFLLTDFKAFSARRLYIIFSSSSGSSSVFLSSGLWLYTFQKNKSIQEVPNTLQQILLWRNSNPSLNFPLNGKALLLRLISTILCRKDLSLLVLIQTSGTEQSSNIGKPINWELCFLAQPLLFHNTLITEDKD